MLAASCGQDYNSNSGDFGQYAPIEGLDSSTEDGTRLLAAYKVMRTKCFSCHGDWAEFKSSEAWIATGRVSAGNSVGSTLFIKILDGTMPPPSAAQMVGEETSKIQAWIDGIPVL